MIGLFHGGYSFLECFVFLWFYYIRVIFASSLQIFRLLKENGSIPSKYVVADLYVLDGNKTIKKGCTSFIDAWSQGIDSGKNFNIVVLKMGQYVKADAKKGFKLDNNVKGLNDKGGFEVPAGRVIYIDMGTRQHNGFDCSAKSDMDLFTINNGASLELVRARVYGDNRKIVIPDNANNTSLRRMHQPDPERRQKHQNLRMVRQAQLGKRGSRRRILGNLIDTI